MPSAANKSAKPFDDHFNNCTKAAITNINRIVFRYCRSQGTKSALYSKKVMIDAKGDNKQNCRRHTNS